MTRALLLLLWVALVSGCGFTSRALSSPREYEAYRATRAGYTREARLRAAKLYLGLFPEGRFAEEVRGRFETEENRFFQDRNKSRGDLEWYLQVLPDGPHASEASLLILEMERRASEQRYDELLARGRTIEQRLAKAEQLRKQTSEALVGWISALAANEAWGRPTWEQSPELIRAIRTEPEPGHCDDQRCLRSRTMVFQIPIAGGGLEERAALFDHILAVQQGRVIRGELRGPALFSRFYEAARGRPLPKDPLEARAEAVSYVLEVVSGAFEAVAPGAACDRGITPPVVFFRQCNGWRVTASAGDGTADDDVIEVEGPRAP